MVYQSGVVPDGSNLVTDAADPDIWLLRDCMFDTGGKEVSMFWQAADYESNTLPVKVTFDPSDPRFYSTHKIRFFPPSGAPIVPTAGQIDRITLQVKMQPVGRDVLDEVVNSGDLDAGIRDAMPTLPVGGMLDLDPGHRDPDVRRPDDGRDGLLRDRHQHQHAGRQVPSAGADPLLALTAEHAVFTGKQRGHRISGQARLSGQS